jgi:hypothetical protein
MVDLPDPDNPVNQTVAGSWRNNILADMLTQVDFRLKRLLAGHIHSSTP